MSKLKQIANKLGLGSSYDTSIAAWRAKGEDHAAAEVAKKTSLAARMTLADSTPAPRAFDDVIRELHAKTARISAENAVLQADPDANERRESLRKGFEIELKHVRAEQDGSAGEPNAGEPPIAPAPLESTDVDAIERKAAEYHAHAEAVVWFEAGLAPASKSRRLFPSLCRAHDEADRLYATRQRAQGLPVATLFVATSVSGDPTQPAANSGAFFDAVREAGGGILEGLARISEADALTPRLLEQAIALLGPKLVDARPFESDLKRLEADRARAVKREEAIAERRSQYERARIYGGM